VKTAATILAMLLAGCGATSSYQRAHEIEANLPRAQGLGAFTPACFIFCFATAHFTHGDDTIDPNATEALMHSKMNVQVGAQVGAQVGGAKGATVSSGKGRKKSPPPPPPGAKP
jgi:hypothetical protein